MCDDQATPLLMIFIVTLLLGSMDCYDFLLHMSILLGEAHLYHMMVILLTHILNVKNKICSKNA